MPPRWDLGVEIKDEIIVIERAVPWGWTWVQKMKYEWHLMLILIDWLVSSLNMLKYGLNIMYYEIFSVSSCVQMHGTVDQHGSRVSFWGWLKDSLLEWVWIAPCGRFCFSNYQDGLLVRCLTRFWLLCASLPCTGAVSILTSMEDEPQPCSRFRWIFRRYLSESHKHQSTTPKVIQNFHIGKVDKVDLFCSFPALKKAPSGTRHA